jgi:hypothetical protein
MAAFSEELRWEPDLQVFAKKLEQIFDAAGEPRAEAILTIATLVRAINLAHAVGDVRLSREILGFGENPNELSMKGTS